MSHIPTITVQTLKQYYDTNPNTCILDVRELDEWQSGHIKGALHIPKDQVAAIVEEKIPDHNTAVYIHCKGGVRSLTAAQVMRDKGYTNVFSVEGGIMAWENAGYAVER
jgi:rhodanese-related sulfurtransferase